MTELATLGAALVGRTRRMARPRRQLGDWSPAAHRPDPVALLERQAESRLPELIALRYGRMAVSPAAFYRGAAALMATDLGSAPHNGLYVHACGDAHLLNFGVFATPERQVIFDINDFDEAASAPFEWDLKRLVTSLVVTAAEQDVSSRRQREIALEAVRSYRTEICQAAERSHLDVWYGSIGVDEVLPLLEKTSGKSGALARLERRTNLGALDRLSTVIDGVRRLIDDPPLVEHVGGWSAKRLVAILDGYAASLQPASREVFARYEPIDLARKVVGVGSVGLRAWVVLMQGSGTGDPLFLQLKEAQDSVLRPYVPVPAMGHNGQRVVHAQPVVQASTDLFLGWATDERDDRHYYVRQLRDMKGSVEPSALSGRELERYGALCARALAAGHARSGAAAAIAGYLGDGGPFDDSIVSFATAYAEQNQRDYESLVAAIESGRVAAIENL